MTAAALALLSLAAGFLVSSIWTVSRARASRQDGHPLYFSSALFAVVVVFFGLCIHGGLREIGPAGQAIDNFIGLGVRELLVTERGGLSPETFAMSVVWGTIGATLLAFAANFPGYRNKPLLSHLLSQTGSMDDMEKLLWGISKKEIPLMVTLDSGKVYVGYWTEFPRAGRERKWLRIEPVLSGYRDAVNHHFEDTTDYAFLRDELPRDHQTSRSRSDFDVLIPIDRIVSIHGFDLVTYALRFARLKPASSKTSSATTEGAESAKTSSEEVAVRITTPEATTDEYNHTPVALMLYWVYVMALVASPPMFRFEGLIPAGVLLFVSALIGMGSRRESRVTP